MAPKGKSSGKEDKGGAGQLKVSDVRSQGGGVEGGSGELARSPSGISLSRPQSLLAPSRVSNFSTPAAIPSSPSSRSIVDRTSAVGANAGQRDGRSDGATGLSVGESSAMGRLRRVASNASIASSIRPRRPAVTTTNDGEGGTVRGGSPIAEDTTGSARPTDRLAEDGKGEDGGKNDTAAVDGDGFDRSGVANEVSTSKRPLAENAETIKGKQAKRKTWFGYVTSQNDESDAGKADVDEGIHDGSIDGQGTIKAAQEEQASDIQVKSWLPWRGPANGEPAAAESGEQTEGMDADATEVPATYTDSVRRYISWGSQQVFGTAPTSPNPGWGWTNWRSTSAQEESAVEVAKKHGKHARTLSDEEAQKAGAKAIIESDGAQAIELDVSKWHNDSDMDATPATSASPGQGSFIYRWMPAWNRATQPAAAADNSESAAEGGEQTAASQEPTTPAELYKAEALAHLGAKDAILNTATRSTWINYFSSRAAAPSQRMDHKDANEPEVMRIEGGGSMSGTGKEAEKGKPNGVPARLAGVKTAAGSGATTPADTQSVAGSEPAPQPKGKESTSNAAAHASADPAPMQSRPATPLTKNKEMAKQVVAAAQKQKESVLGGAGKTGKAPVKVAPNLLLPSFEDAFTAPPRSTALKTGMWEKTMSILFSKDHSKDSNATSAPPSSFAKAPFGSGNGGQQQARLPRLWSTLGDKEKASTNGCKDVRKVTIIGIHGWFSQGPIRNLFGEPTGTSSKFAGMMTEAVRQHFERSGFSLKDADITSIALQADGLVSDRVDKSFAALLANPKWVKDLATSDAIFVAAHSQGSIVATHLLARLVEQRHLDPRRSRTVLLCMCGIHNGPFAHLRGSISSYYMSTFETPAARELFDFQNGQSPVSRLYAASLRIVCASGIKLVYVASLDDQVVPLFSALHTSASHPSMLRAIFCDGAAFPRVDFLTNLLSFCVNVRNAGLWDHHLVTLLSSSVAGSLYGGLGHSLVYDDVQVYGLAVRYLLEVSSPLSWPTARSGRGAGGVDALGGGGGDALTGLTSANGVPKLDLDDGFTLSRNQKWNSNPYSLPWSLRGLLEDNLVRQYFSAQIDKLISDYLDWQPSTKTLKDVQFRLEPMRLIAGEVSPSASKKAVGKTSNSKL